MTKVRMPASRTAPRAGGGERAANRAAPALALGAAAAMFDAVLEKVAAQTGHVIEAPRIIPVDQTFRQWCDELAAGGMKVDGKPFRLDDRPALAWIYDRIPSTVEEAFGHTLVLMKCAQVGFTVMEMLVTIYIALKFGPATIGMFLPDVNLASIKSTHRFMPIIRSIPAVHALMVEDAEDGSGRRAGEGNVRTRGLGNSLFIFSWTSGKASTESVPMDMLAFDEVQEMSLADMEKTQERLSGSALRYTLMGSTANWPDSDIHFWWKQGTQWAFHSKCPTCGTLKPLDEYFPDCIGFDPGAVDALTKRMGTSRYRCQAGHWLDDPQHGVWIAGNPDAWIDSIHFPQMLSPTISASDIMTKWHNSTDKKNFHNRVLGKPYLDPTQTPVTLEHMANCVAHGIAAGLKWKKGARGTFMGIDQMGNFNVVIIKERLEDGRQAVVHVEEIYHEDPFLRCSELMGLYGVAVAVVEINPNYNDAKRFSGRHPGRVFICDSFGSLPEDMVRWGDAPKLDPSDRRTDEDERDRWTVKVDQYKTMQTSFARFTAPRPLCLWPDPQDLVQEVVDKGVKQRVAVAPRAFYHFTKTALVAEKDEDTNKFKRVVRKISIDPHFSYANQLCDVAWARAHGTALIIIPEIADVQADRRAAAAAAAMPGLPTGVMAMMQTLPAGEVCGRCEAYPIDAEGNVAPAGMCKVRNFIVRARDPGCDLFVGMNDF